jgi:hypothetical protein
VAGGVAVDEQLEAFAQLLAGGDLQAAVDALHGVAMGAGESAGMRVVIGRQAPRRARFHKPWYDAECRAAKARVAALDRAYKQDYQQLRALLQRKRRAWQQRINSQLDEECAERGQQCLWRGMRKGVGRGAPNVCDVSSHHIHLSAKFAGAGVAGAAGEQAAPTAEEAASVINEETVQLALSKINKQAAVGIPGVPVQALKAPKLVQALVQLLQAVYVAGYEPCNMNEGLLVPVHKRGDATLPNSYRPIVVSCVLHKIYAWCINHSMRKWMREQPRDVLPRHCGFLPKRSTMHNVFMLSNAMHHAAGRGERLCVLLLDIASAFDNVDHACMVATLSELGLPQHLVRAVHGMYSGLQYRLRCEDGRLTEPLEVGVGVKQGCPASPLLFCLYVQPVSGSLESEQEVAVYSLDGHKLPDWAYADDFVLLAYTTAGLEHLTGAAATAFLERRLRIEPAKCVVLGVNVPEGVSVSLLGQQVPRAPPSGQCYLGAMFDDKARPGTMAQHRAQCMQTAFREARGRIHASADVVGCMPVILRVLNQGITPVGVYASEVWGLGSLPRAGCGDFGLSHFYSLSDPVEAARCGLIRLWLRLPQSTPKACLLHELGLQPLSHEYTFAAVRLWNTLVAMKEDSPYRLALVQNIHDAFDSRFKCVNYTRALHGVLQLLGVVDRGLVSCMRALNYINPDVVKEKLAARYQEWVQSLIAGSGVGRGIIRQYFTTVGTHEGGHRPDWYCISVPHKVAVGFLRFRIGCHHLRVNTGRWRVPKLARGQRKCIRCTGVFERDADVPVDDESHCLIDCQEPVLAQHRRYLEHMLRRWHPHPAHNSMQELFAAVQETGRKCVQRELMGFVARCYRVARSCHEDLAAWQASPEVQKAVGLQRLDEWIAEQDALYAQGMVPGLPSDTTIDESSELSEVSVQGPAAGLDGVGSLPVSASDSEEWEDVV